MSDASFARVRDLFERASEMEAGARTRFIAEQCAGDAGLRARLERMLESQREDSRFLASPVGAVDLAELAAADAAANSAADSAAAADPMVGTRFGQYHVREVLGRGGMGVVYLAEQERPRRTVALKLIRSAILMPAMLKRFEHEAEVLARLKHPGIAQIYEAGTAAGADGRPQPFFAMELVRGRTLLEYAAEKKLGTRERLTLFAMICDAVQHAHQKGVIHRDLKPSNILVEEEGTGGRSDEVAEWRSDGVTKERGGASTAPSSGTEGDARTRVQEAGKAAAASSTATSFPSSLRHSVTSSLSAQPKILDFGVARVTDSDVAVTTMQTDVGQVIGTLQYMSPEQARGENASVDTRSDVYSLGVILFQLLAGRLPYDVTKRGIAEAARIISEQDPSTLSQVSRTLRGDLETIASKALEKEAARRYQSAADLAADIRRYLGDLPIVARPATASYQLRKFARRNKVLVGGVLAVMAALIVGVVSTSAALVRARRAEATAQKEATEAKTQAERSRRTLGFVNHVFMATDARTTGAKNWTMNDLLGDLAARAESELADDPKVASAIYNMIATSYMSISDMDRAAVYVARAEEMSRTHFGAGSAEHVESVLSQAHLARVRNDLAKATEYGRSALAMIEALPQAAPRDRAIAMAALGEVLAAQKLTEGEALLRRAIDLIGTDRKDTSYRLDMRTILGDILWLSGDFARAEETMRETLVESRAAFGDQHPDVALTLMALARALQHGGKRDEAITHLREAHAIFHRVYPPGHRLYGIAEEGLAYALMEAGRLDEAEPMAREYLSRIEAKPNAEPRDLLRAVSLRALVAMRRKNYGEEEAMRVRQLEISRTLNGESHFATKEITLALAQCYINLQKLEEAGKILEPLLDPALDGKADTTRVDALLMAARWMEARNDAARTGEILERASKVAEAMPASPTKRLAAARRYSAWLERQGKGEEAEGVLTRVAEALTAKYGAEHVAVKSVGKELEGLRGRRGKGGEGE